MKRIVKISILLLTAFAFLINCNKSGGNGVINIQGFHTTDYNGNFITQIGPPDSDWSFKTSLSQAELSLFHLFTSLDLSNTVVTTTSNGSTAFPNPASTQQNYFFSATDSNVVKLVIVDASLHVAYKTATKIKGNMVLQIDISDRTVFPNRTSFRAYFSYSALGHEDYKVGYGDIRICDGTSVPACF
jgi:hypothetical protein